MTGTVGFVIIGRNEGPRLEQCLRSALAHSSRVVYADSASSDGSVSLAEQLGVVTVVLPDDGKLSAARGRNAGFAMLATRFPDCDCVQFLDGDCVLQPSWVERAAEFMSKHPEVAVVCGRRFEAHPDASIYNRLCDEEWNTRIGETSECGGDALIRRTAFDQVHGYRSALRAGEEPEMTARMRSAGWRIWRIDAAMTEHDAHILTLRQWWRRTQRGGFGFAQVWNATSDLPTRLYGRNLRSAFTWAVGIPVAFVVATLLTTNALILLLVPLTYGLQLVRLARKSRAVGLARWTGAGLMLLAKFPEALGAARFFLSRDHGVPEYKS